MFVSGQVHLSWSTSPIVRPQGTSVPAIHSVPGIPMSKAVLIADLPEPAEFARRALIGDYTPICVHSFDDAIDAVTNSQFSLIICGLHFDESRMMELLWKVKQLPSYEVVPFLCIQTLEAHPETTDSVKTVHEALGAAGFVEIPDLDGNGASILRREVEGLIGK